MGYGIIYGAINLVNGKCYIGQTIKSLDVRKRRHLNDAKRGVSTYFHRSIRKYGENAFRWGVIDDTCEDAEELNEMEVHYVIQYKSFGKWGYNLTWGGGGSSGMVCSEETRKKMCSRNHSEETKRKMREAKLGNTYNCKSIYKVTTPSGNVDIITNLYEYCRQNNLHQGAMSEVASGKRKHHKGYRVEKISNVPEVVYDTTTPLMEVFFGV